MGFLEEKCHFCVYNEQVISDCPPFNCGHEESSKDLNEFFAEDAINYSRQLLGKSYCFVLDEDPHIIVCAFTLSNDSINVNILPNSRKKKVIKTIPHEKHFSRYPAVLIGRLGLNEAYQGKNEGYPKKIADELMDFIKAWFADYNNKTGCRFLAVDSYNDPRALKYYAKNGFEHIFSSEKQEREQIGVAADKRLETRLLYFDLIVLASPQEN